jgi:hypothetical protein
VASELLRPALEAVERSMIQQAVMSGYGVVPIIDTIITTGTATDKVRNNALFLLATNAVIAVNVAKYHLWKTYHMGPTAQLSPYSTDLDTTNGMLSRLCRAKECTIEGPADGKCRTGQCWLVLTANSTDGRVRVPVPDNKKELFDLSTFGRALDHRLVQTAQWRSLASVRASLLESLASYDTELDIDATLRDEMKRVTFSILAQRLN